MSIEFIFFFCSILVIFFYFASKSISHSFFKKSFSEYNTYQNKPNINGSEVAQEVLKNKGINDVSIKKIEGMFIDQYNPIQRCIYLSSNIFLNRSISSLAISCHEANHAVQFEKKNILALIRKDLASLIKYSQIILIPIILFALLGSREIFFIIVSISYFIVTVFALFTLLLEADASIKTLKFIKNTKISFSKKDYYGVKKVLWAALFTYIASFLSNFVVLLLSLTFTIVILM